MDPFLFPVQTANKTHSPAATDNKVRSPFHWLHRIHWGLSGYKGPTQETGLLVDGFKGSACLNCLLAIKTRSKFQGKNRRHFRGNAQVYWFWEKAFEIWQHRCSSVSMYNNTHIYIYVHLINSEWNSMLSVKYFSLLQHKSLRKVLSKSPVQNCYTVTYSMRYHHPCDIPRSSCQNN